MKWTEQQREQQMTEIDIMIDELELKIDALYISPAVKRAAVNKLYAVWTELEEGVELVPADYE
jgi:hypothetical protein